MYRWWGRRPGLVPSIAASRLADNAPTWTPYGIGEQLRTNTMNACPLGGIDVRLQNPQIR